jgi:hypothetical protein
MAGRLGLRETASSLRSNEALTIPIADEKKSTEALETFSWLPNFSASP